MEPTQINNEEKKVRTDALTDLYESLVMVLSACTDQQKRLIRGRLEGLPIRQCMMLRQVLANQGRIDVRGAVIDIVR